MQSRTPKSAAKPVFEVRRYPGELVIYIDRPSDQESRLAIAPSLTGILERIGHSYIVDFKAMAESGGFEPPIELLTL